MNLPHDSYAEAVARHYDALVDWGDDPARDDEPLRSYMDRWDGPDFLLELNLNTSLSVLEIGVGTGRLAQRVAPMCRQFLGVDLSPKAIARARENLSELHNTSLLCGDFLNLDFPHSFHRIYSSLTFQHMPDKAAAIRKVATLLAPGGQFLLSVDADTKPEIDAGFTRIATFPATPEEIQTCILAAGLHLQGICRRECAWIFSAEKPLFPSF